jgi:hypothetical protein
MATKGALGFERGTRGASHLLECRKHERHFRVKLEEAMAPLIKDSRIGMPLEAAHWPVKALAFPQRAVEIDGHDVREIHPLELRSEIALVRGLDLFHGTIEENLTLANERVSSNRVREALSMVGVLEDIYALPDGLQTVLQGQPAPL